MVLGQVTHINKYDVTLSLPNSLTGYVPLTSISDKVTALVEALAVEETTSDDEMEGKDIEEFDLKSFVSVGQYLRAYVMSTEAPSDSGNKGKKHIELSIHPQLVNSGLAKSDLVANTMVQAMISSVEDHGLVMNIGLEDTTIRGFMGSKDIGQDLKLADLKEGGIFLCLVTGLSSNGNVVKLSADPRKIGDIRKSNFLADAPTVDAFLPGTAVEVLLSEVKTSGLAGKVMGVLDVTADLIQSGAAASSRTLDNRYTVGTKIKARVICTFPAAEEKKLGISLLEHILAWSPRSLKDSSRNPRTTDMLQISSFVDQARVAKVEPGFGLFLDIGVQGVRGFVHISQVSDGKVEALYESTGAYKVGSIHRGRIIGYNAMDGLFLVSLQQKILDLPFLRLEDVQVGQIVKGTVRKLVINAVGVGGVLLDITESISGLVPEMHLADVHLQHPEKRFREGAAVTARVLSVDVERRLMRLTLKKALVHSEAAVWKSYNDLVEGMQSPGTLVNILPAGAVVQFYGSVRGFLPVSQMSETYIKDPKQHFRVGQVVDVRIVSLDREESRMIVSCKEPAEFSSTQQTALKELGLGEIVSGVVLEKTADQIVVELHDSGLKASLPFEHLVDGSIQKSLNAAKKIRIGQSLQDLLVLNKNETKRTVKLTNKPSLLKASKSGVLPKSLTTLRQSFEVVGYVKNIIAAGVFIQYHGELTGFLPAKQLHEDIREQPDFGLRKDQTIVARVLSINHTQQRFSLTQLSLAAPIDGSQIGQMASHVPSRILSNPIDGTSTSVEDFYFGKLSKARIISIKETQLNVQLADGIQGRIDVSQVFDTWDEIKDRKHPLNIFNPKQVLSVRVLGVHDSRNHRFLPISHSGKAPVFELSAKPKDQIDDDLDVLNIDKIMQGSSWVVFVNHVSDDCLWVNLSPNVRGRIRAMDVSDDLSLLADIVKNFPVGSALRARVVHVDVENNRLDLTARSGSTTAPITIKDLSRGMVLPGRVTKVTERHIMVQLSESVSAPVHIVDLADDYDTANPTVYQKNQMIRVCVTDLDVPNKKITLSARPSKVLNSSLPVRDPEIASISQLEVNDVVRGFIKNVADNGVFVSLASNITAFARVADLSDAFIKDWKACFEIDQLVQGKIIALNPTLHQIQLSLKRSVMDKDYKAPLTYADIHVGQTLTGKIRKVEDFGVFIVVDNSANVSGLCHRSEIAEGKVQDVKKLYDEGDAVKARVLKVDLDKRRISFGLKASYFVDESGNLDSDDDGSDNLDDIQLINDAESEAEVGDIDTNMNHFEDVPDGQDSIADRSLEDNATHIDDSDIDSYNGVGLQAGGFDWTGGLNDSEMEEKLSDTDREAHNKKKKRRKAEIKIDHTADLDANGPQSASDFERLLLGQSNSSYLWLSYMAFQLQLSEVPKAREIAERATRTIVQSRDTDGEVLNVWVAYLNLENTYGSEETVEEVFRRACEHNDVEEMHSRLISIYIQSGKNEASTARLRLHRILTDTLSECRCTSPSHGQEIFSEPQGMAQLCHFPLRYCGSTGSCKGTASAGHASLT